MAKYRQKAVKKVKFFSGVPSDVSSITTFETVEAYIAAKTAGRNARIKETNWIRISPSFYYKIQWEMVS